MTAVKVHVAGELLIRHLLRLPQDAVLKDAAVADRMLVLTVDVPIVPGEADSMVPVYTRRTDIPDPIALTGMDWYRDGQRLESGEDAAASPAARTRASGAIPAYLGDRVTLFGLRHTLRWVLHNAAEFDRRHLRGAGRWLFGRRPVRPQRPPRRITTVLLLGAWLALLTANLPFAQVAVMAAVLAVVLLLVLTIATWPVAMSRVKRQRRG